MGASQKMVSAGTGRIDASLNEARDNFEKSKAVRSR